MFHSENKTMFENERRTYKKNINEFVFVTNKITKRYIFGKRSKHV